MKFLSASICALLLLFFLLGRFFVAAVDWGGGAGANYSPLQASLRALTGEGIKEAKLEVEDWVSPQGLDGSLVTVQQYAGQSAGARSLLNSDSVSGAVLVVHEDGKFELKDTGSEATLWEIPTDNPLPSQSQLYIPTDSDYFLIPGQGSELYIFTRSAGIEKHPLSIEEYVTRTPEIRDSTVTIGSKSSTMYTVDADTGEIIYQSALPVNLSQFGVSVTEDPSLPSQLPSGTPTKERNSKFNYITIVRTDYTVSCSDISRTLWNWTTSFFMAYYPNGNRYMLKPASHADGTIPIQFKGKELLLAWSIDENAHLTNKFKPLQLDSIGDDNRPLKDSLNGLVAAPVYPVNGNRNGLVMSERPFKITDAETNFTNVKRLGYHSWVVLPFLCLVVSIVLYWKWLKEAQKKDKEVTKSNARQNGVSKKKKSRKNGVISRDSTGSMPGTTDDRSSSDGEKLLESQIKEKLLAHMQTAESSEGKWVGKLLVSSKEIGRGSNGTVVLEGVYEGRPVAVKRLLHAHHDVALKEIRNLIASDQHPNIVRLYGVEQDVDFVYISLERCSCSLADLILFFSGDVSGAGLGVRFSMSGKGMDKDMMLWRENGLPSPQLLKLMRLVTS